ncbi:hypothetical protein RUM43_014800, partial [Polyplax serrata]
LKTTFLASDSHSCKAEDMEHKTKSKKTVCLENPAVSGVFSSGKFRTAAFVLPSAAAATAD